MASNTTRKDPPGAVTLEMPTTPKRAGAGAVSFPLDGHKNGFVEQQHATTSVSSSRMDSTSKNVTVGAPLPSRPTQSSAASLPTSIVASDATTLTMIPKSASTNTATRSTFATTTTATTTTSLEEDGSSLLSFLATTSKLPPSPPGTLMKASSVMGIRIGTDKLLATSISAGSGSLSSSSTSSSPGKRNQGADEAKKKTAPHHQDKMKTKRKNIHKKKKHSKKKKKKKNKHRHQDHHKHRKNDDDDDEKKTKLRRVTKLAAVAAAEDRANHDNHRIGLFVCSCFYTFLFVGSYFGWGPMQLMLEANGAFAWKCTTEYDDEYGTTPATSVFVDFDIGNDDYSFYYSDEEEDDSKSYYNTSTNSNSICPEQTAALINVQLIASLSQLDSPLLGQCMDYYGCQTMAYVMITCWWLGLILLNVSCIFHVDFMLYVAFSLLAHGMSIGALLIPQTATYFQQPGQQHEQDQEASSMQRNGQDEEEEGQILKTKNKNKTKKHTVVTASPASSFVLSFLTPNRVIFILNSLFDAGGITYWGLWYFGQQEIVVTKLNFFHRNDHDDDYSATTTSSGMTKSLLVFFFLISVFTLVPSVYYWSKVVNVNSDGDVVKEEGAVVDDSGESSNGDSRSITNTTRTTVMIHNTSSEFESSSNEEDEGGEGLGRDDYYSWVPPTYDEKKIEEPVASQNEDHLAEEEDRRHHNHQHNDDIEKVMASVDVEAASLGTACSTSSVTTTTHLPVIRSSNLLVVDDDNGNDGPATTTTPSPTTTSILLEQQETTSVDVVDTSEEDAADAVDACPLPLPVCCSRGVAAIVQQPPPGSLSSSISSSTSVVVVIDDEEVQDEAVVAGSDGGDYDYDDEKPDSTGSYVLVSDMNTPFHQLTSKPCLMIILYFAIHNSANYFTTSTTRDYLSYLGDDNQNNYYLTLFTLLMPASLLALPFVDYITIHLGFIGGLQTVNILGISFLLIRVFETRLNYMQIVGFILSSFYRCFLGGVVFSYLPTLLSNKVVGKAMGLLYMANAIIMFINIPLANYAIKEFDGNFMIPNLIYVILLLPCIVLATMLGRTTVRTN